MSDKKIVDALNTLLTRNYDSEKGYEQIAEKIDKGDLKEYFQHAYKERYHFGHEIKEILKDYDAKPDKGSSVLADAHRVWIDVKDFLTGKSDKAIIEEAIRGEEMTIDDYRKGLDISSLKEEHQRTLKDQYEAIKTSKAELERMRDAL